MSNLVFALNATMPVFLVMVTGFVLRRIGVISEDFASKMNRLVFIVALPVSQFRQTASTDLAEVWDTGFVLFCFFATLLSIIIAWFLSRFIKNHSERGEFIQVSYRSSAALLGSAYLIGIYGNAEMLPLMIIGCVVLYNVIAVIVLETMKPEEAGKGTIDAKTRKRLVHGIVTNPILIGIAAGVIWALLRIPIPKILDSTLSTIASLTTPMGLIAMGASIRPEEIRGELRDAGFATFIKLMLLSLIFTPIAAAVGFRGQKLVAILVMLGSPATISCYVMARNMGHKGNLTSNTILLSTLLGSGTMTVWIFLLRTFGWL